MIIHIWYLYIVTVISWNNLLWINKVCSGIYHFKRIYNFKSTEIMQAKNLVYE